MKTRLVFAALLLAASPLHAQASLAAEDFPECDDGFRGSARARRAHDDSANVAFARIRESMAEELRAAVRASGVAEPAGVVVLTVDSVLHPTITPLDINFPAEVLREVLPRLLDQAAAMPRPGLECNGVALRLDPLPRAARDSAWTRPEPANGNQILQGLKRWADEHRGQPRTTALMSVVVLRDGAVALPRLRRSSGSDALDRFVLDLMATARFRPATTGGVPEDFFLMLPLTFDLGGSRPPHSSATAPR